MPWPVSLVRQGCRAFGARTCESALVAFRVVGGCATGPCPPRHSPDNAHQGSAARPGCGAQSGTPTDEASARALAAPMGAGPAVRRLGIWLSRLPFEVGRTAATPRPIRKRPRRRRRLPLNPCAAPVDNAAGNRERRRARGVRDDATVPDPPPGYLRWLEQGRAPPGQAIGVTKARRTGCPSRPRDGRP